MKEIWKNIPDYDGYQVSNYGRVRTYNKTTYTEKHGIRHWKNRILKNNIDKRTKSYTVSLWKNGKPKTYLVHRLEAFTFYGGNINDKYLTVDHLNGDRNNNKLSNLEIVSLEENIKRAFKNNLMPTTKIKIINKLNREEKIFYYLAESSRYIKKSNGYISGCIKKNKYENKEYKWEILKGSDK